MKNPFSRRRGSAGTYSPRTTELTHVLSSSENESSIQQDAESSSIVASEDMLDSTIESQNKNDVENTEISEISDSPKKNPKKSALYRFLARIGCFSSEENESDAEIYHPDLKSSQSRSFDNVVYDPHQATELTPISPLIFDKYAPHHDIATTLQDAEGFKDEITDKDAQQQPTHPVIENSTEKSQKSTILSRFWAKLRRLLPAAKDSCSTNQDLHPNISQPYPADSLGYMLNSLDPEHGTYISFDRCDDDYDKYEGQVGDSTTITVTVTALNTPIKSASEHNPIIEVASQQALKEDAHTLQPPVKPQRGRPVSYSSYKNLSLDGYENISSDTHNHITAVQISSLPGDIQSSSVSFPRLEKSFKTRSTPDVSSTINNMAHDNPGKLQQRSMSSPNLLSSINDTDPYPTDLLDHAYNLNSVCKVSNTNVTRSSSSTDSSPVHEKPEESDITTSGDVRRAMRKINRPNFSEKSKGALLKSNQSFAGKVSNTRDNSQSGSSVSEIIKLFEEKCRTTTCNSPMRDISNTMHR